MLGAIVELGGRLKRITAVHAVTDPWSTVCGDFSSLTAAKIVVLLITGAPLFVDDKAITVLDLLASSSSSSGDTVAKTQPRKAMQSSMIAGSRSGNQAGSLLEFLDRAASPGGRRTLQQWICR